MCAFPERRRLIVAVFEGKNLERWKNFLAFLNG